jgi:phospholipase C
MIVVSPFAKRGYVDHTVMDHTSMLKFLADNWGLPYLTRREAQAGNLTSGFEFANGTMALARSVGAFVGSTVPGSAFPASAEADAPVERL